MIETVFDTGYLLFVFAASVYFFVTAGGDTRRLLFGMMPALLLIGDGCHLVPRVLSFFYPASFSVARARALGKCAASITMTVFYMVLARVLTGYFRLDVSPFLIAAIWVLGLLRIMLCLFPLRQWTHPGKSAVFPILRNIPFALLGILVAVISIQPVTSAANPFLYLWLAILLSFAFYIPVVLLSDRYPPIGMLMLPKTAMYVWMVCMGLQL